MIVWPCAAEGGGGGEEGSRLGQTHIARGSLTNRLSAGFISWPPWACGFGKDERCHVDCLCASPSDAICHVGRSVAVGRCVWAWTRKREAPPPRRRANGGGPCSPCGQQAHKAVQWRGAERTERQGGREEGLDWQEGLGGGGNTTWHSEKRWCKGGWKRCRSSSQGRTSTGCARRRPGVWPPCAPPLPAGAQRSVACRSPVEPRDQHFGKSLRVLQGLHPPAPPSHRAGPWLLHPRLVAQWQLAVDRPRCLCSRSGGYCRLGLVDVPRPVH